MSRQLQEFETLLQHLLAEHRKLLSHVEAQHAAMRTMDLAEMDAARNQQEAIRLRIATLENRRRGLVGQLAKALRTDPALLTLSRLAELHPPRREALLKVRAELKELAETISRRTYLSGRLATAVLGHLNNVVRLLAGAVEKAGLYTKQGIPQVSSRIGRMEAVG